MERSFIIIIIGIGLFSCEEPFRLDPDQTPTNYAIEALLTDISAMQAVKVTRSSDFYSSGQTPRITDAIVTVTDDLGNVVPFVHNPRSHADSAGIYVPAYAFTGVIGRTYNLRVESAGRVFEASDMLLPVIPIDSMAYRIDREEEADPKDEGRFYEVLLFATEPRDEKNYYLFKFYRNDTLTFANDTDIYYSDDQLLAENIAGLPAPIYFGKNDAARIEAFSISRKAFVYYSDLWSLLNNDAGGMFGPIPASPRTNLSNGALGFFQVSAVSIRGLKIE